jgi:hypothetical protein
MSLALWNPTRTGFGVVGWEALWVQGAEEYWLEGGSWKDKVKREACQFQAGEVYQTQGPGA